MSSITIEMVDKVMERVPSASYKEVKEALVHSDGDILEAIIYLEENSGAIKAKKKVEDFFEKSKEDAEEVRKNTEEKIGKDVEELKAQLKELFAKSNRVRVVVEKEGKIIMNIPFTVGVLGIAMMPLITILGLSAAVLSKYRIKIQNEADGETVDLGELNEEKATVLKDMFINTAKDLKETVVKKKEEKDDKDITDDLINECEKDENAE
ncbi:MAG: DUF4342 domain-containing protein [Peptacetobacter hiranonis]|uniref:DUF4342 domain-containing protein n=1 Tax=Peptacetobacter hiranonis TaxID=89152 RepID=UPI0022E35464|nr:DUF4342 domain-containing protein [Peptacetobacter hiranonis]MED9947551.1 DUF4342 domain-containing protein [Peptacetobacter hiranonis]